MKKRDRVLRLRNSPLVHVLAQVVFAPVLSMRDHIPAIQSQLRRAGLPRYQEHAIQTVLLSGGAPEVASKRRWDFIDREAHLAVSLMEEAVVLQTSAYGTFEPFLDMLHCVLDSVAQESSPSLVERVGLRTIDIVHPKQGERLAEYLQPGLLGFPFEQIPESGGRPGGFRVESVSETTVGGVLAIRCYQLPPGQFLPPDLVPSPLEYPLWLQKLTSAAALDFDHYSIRAFDFRTPDIIERLWDLHDVIGSALRRAVTEHAWSVWDPEEVTLK
jgi:uncharacterized protein (TIGR04255 family)